MKATSVNAAVFSSGAESVIRFYEENFGFKVIHKTELNGGLAPLAFMASMEGENGGRIDVIQHDGAASDANGLRINTDYFEEAVAAYGKLGYSISCGPAIADSAMTALLTKDGGAPVLLIQHIQK